jgi:hypothetical protein
MSGKVETVREQTCKRSGVGLNSSEVVPNYWRKHLIEFLGLYLEFIGETFPS